ncbi:T9SS type A sorting domain-containing protein [Flavobacterium sp.]|uniref:T9SS type A sorting domain-containing protein n=1 Tax=Flavobacterium sp. TaxID=239 RepID=UPI003D6C1654
MKKITLLLFTFMLAVVTKNYAQVSSYSFSQSNDTFTEITGGTVLVTATANTNGGSMDSFASSALALPFSFNYNGTSVSTVFMSSNGFVSLGATAPSAFTTTPISSTSTANGIISPWSGDLNSFFNLGSRTGEMRWETIGVAPDREIVFQWKDFRPAYTNSTTNAYGFNYQVRLLENGNLVKIVYGPGSFAVGSTAVTGATSRQIGLRGTTPSDFNNRVFTSFASASTAGPLNSAANSFSTATNFPASGLTLTWTPPALCTGTPVAGSVTPANQNICSGVTPANLVGAGFTTGASGITFQWEESDDNGVADAWANAVGGSNATTSTYTPPAFSGTAIYYRLNVTCSGSALSTQTTSVVVSPPANPTTQVTNLAMGTTTLTTIPLNWVNGNGSRRVVYFSDSPTFTDPVNGNAAALTAATAYSGSGQQIVYDGTGTGVTVTALTSGTTYYAKVYEYLRCGSGPYDFYYNVSTGTNILTVTPASVPVNDNFVNAIAITCGNNYSGNTSYATIDEANATLQFGVDLDSPNVWYKFTGSGAAQTVTLNLCGSNYDSSVLVLTGVSGALTAIAGNDDDATGCAPNGTRSKVNFTSDGTTTYYIAIEGYNVGSVGTYTMDVTCAAVNPPAVANQDCVTSLVVNVDGTDTVSDNSYGNVSSAQPTCDPFGSIQDVWFSFVAPSSGAVNCLVTNGTMTSSNFTVYSGACGALTEVTGTCNSNLVTPTTEALTGLVVGNTYYVQVWSNAAEQGTFTLKLTDTALNNQSFDTTNFMVYPNPVKDVLNLSYSKNISTVSVHNLLGQVVMSKNINAPQSKIDLSNLSSGTYLVKVTVDNLVKTVKIVKE